MSRRSAGAHARGRTIDRHAATARDGVNCSMPPARPPKPPPARPPLPPPPPPAAGAYRGATMLVHFRETPYGLAMSLVETRRESGKVRHEHVASLGSIETPPSVAARIEFWRGLHERLAQLSNRLDAERRGKVIGAVHARVPMVMPDEQRALQLEKAKVPGR